MNFPCPHCGSNKSLADRDETEIKSIITEEIQFDSSSISPNSNESTKSLSNLRVSDNIPLEFILPSSLPNASLQPTELKLYLQLALEFRIIINRAKNYQDGMQNWNVILPDRLQKYGLDKETWDIIAALGDEDPKIQEKLRWLLKKISELS